MNSCALSWVLENCLVVTAYLWWSRWRSLSFFLKAKTDPESTKVYQWYVKCQCNIFLFGLHGLCWEQMKIPHTFYCEIKIFKTIGDQKSVTAIYFCAKVSWVHFYRLTNKKATNLKLLNFKRNTTNIKKYGYRISILYLLLDERLHAGFKLSKL